MEEEQFKSPEELVDFIVKKTFEMIEKDYVLVPKSNKEKDKRYKPILKALSKSKKSLPTNVISLLTEIDEKKVEKRMVELESMGLIRKTTAKTVRFWKATEKINT